MGSHIWPYRGAHDDMLWHYAWKHRYQVEFQSLDDPAGLSGVVSHGVAVRQVVTAVVKKAQRCR